MPVFKRLRLAAIPLGLMLAVGYYCWLLRPTPSIYTVTDLGVLPGCSASRATAINSRGDVVGTSTQQGANNGQAFLYQGGRLTKLAILPGATSSNAIGINLAGDITGYTNLPKGRHAFLYTKGRLRDLGTLPGFNGSESTGINDSGEVIGKVTNFTGQAGIPPRRGFLYSHGKMIALGILPGFLESSARTINAAGQIAGVCYNSSGRVLCAPVLYNIQRHTMTALAMPTPYWWEDVYHINNLGQVVGNISRLDEITHAALWSGGRLTDLGVPPGFTGSIAQGLNNRGQVVGRCFSDEGPVKIFLRNHVSGNNALDRYLNQDTTRAFVYRNSKMQDLNTLIPRNDDWVLENARDINDRGQIVGYGLHHGQERAFLLTPIHAR